MLLAWPLLILLVMIIFTWDVTTDISNTLNVARKPIMRAKNSRCILNEGWNDVLDNYI
jgi:hypothetical protein